MERISISILLRDPDFNRALKRSLMETGRVNITSGLDSRVLLLDEEGMESFESLRLEEERKGASQLKVVLKKDGNRASWTEETPSMYRYTPADEMVSLLEYITGVRKVDGEEESKIICLLSDEGGCGVSTIGINLSRILSRGRGGAIYLNLSPFASSPKEILWGESDRRGGKAWMRMLFGMRRGKEGILPAVLEKIEEVSYIPVPHVNNHADEIDEEIFRGLRKEAKALGYEYLVFDIGTHPEGNRKKIIASSSAVIAVNPGYDLEADLRMKMNERLITLVNLSREDSVEVKTDQLADIHIGYIPGLGRGSIDMELKEPLERLADLIKEKES